MAKEKILICRIKQKKKVREKAVLARRTKA